MQVGEVGCQSSCSNTFSSNPTYMVFTLKSVSLVCGNFVHTVIKLHTVVRRLYGRLYKKGEDFPWETKSIYYHKPFCCCRMSIFFQCCSGTCCWSSMVTSPSLLTLKDARTLSHLIEWNWHIWIVKMTTLQLHYAPAGLTTSSGDDASSVKRSTSDTPWKLSFLVQTPLITHSCTCREPRSGENVKLSLIHENTLCIGNSAVYVFQYVFAPFSFVSFACYSQLYMHSHSILQYLLRGVRR